MAIRTRRIRGPDPDDNAHSHVPAVITNDELRYGSSGEFAYQDVGSIDMYYYRHQSHSAAQGRKVNHTLPKYEEIAYPAESSETAFGHGHLGSTSHSREVQKIPRLHNAETISKDNTEGHEARMSKLCADLAPKIFHHQRPESETLFNYQPSFTRGSRIVEVARAMGQRIYSEKDDSVQSNPVGLQQFDIVDRSSHGYDSIISAITAIQPTPHPSKIKSTKGGGVAPANIESSVHTYNE